MVDMRICTHRQKIAWVRDGPSKGEWGSFRLKRCPDLCPPSGRVFVVEGPAWAEAKGGQTTASSMSFDACPVVVTNCDLWWVQMTQKWAKMDGKWDWLRCWVKERGGYPPFFFWRTTQPRFPTPRSGGRSPSRFVLLYHPGGVLISGTSPGWIIEEFCNPLGGLWKKI